ncbi:MAG: hypothetical protein EHM81_05525 [Chloroflexi bacterium]|nr:MAG: hypothetical protein EHM81_05525 [Chloroflexota bacterium]
MSRPAKPLLIFLLAIFAVILIRTAWVGDDVYITLRTVDNFVNGYGLRWNVAERVQSYTHPLWLLAMMPVYALSQNAYFTALFLAFLFTGLTLFVVARQPNCLPGLLILLMSKAFMDFSVSGLENPATHLLLALFLALFWGKTDDQPQIRFIGLVAALVALNRLDAVLFLLPVLAYIFYQAIPLPGLVLGETARFRRSEFGGQPDGKAPLRLILTLGSLLLGFLPLILWELFSLLYYGFIFPNTAYAKLGTGLARLDLISQAFVYYTDSLTRDPLTLIAIAAGLLLAVWKGGAKERLVAAGVALYLLYILSIGGDFMSGRFFTAPLLISVLLLMRLSASFSLRAKTVIAAAAVLIGFLAPNPSLLVRTDQPAFTDHDIQLGINDERAYYYQKTGLLTVLRTDWQSFTSRGWAEHGLALRDSGRTVVNEKNVGFTGYFAGPGVFIVDTYALCDPLLARLRAQEQEKWRIGHFDRAIPAGYLQTLKTGENRIKDPHLAQYYDHLSLITRAPLWDLRRLAAIWAMNTGQYIYLLAAYNTAQTTP